MPNAFKHYLFQGALLSIISVPILGIVPIVILNQATGIDLLNSHPIFATLIAYSFSTICIALFGWWDSEGKHMSKAKRTGHVVNTQARGHYVNFHPNGSVEVLGKMF